MVRKRTRLLIVPKADPQATVIRLTELGPRFTGDEDEDLVCGACDTIICPGLSIRSLTNTVVTATQLVFGCARCGRCNVVPLE